MASLRGLIITLMILGFGIFVIQRVGEGFLSQPGVPSAVGGFGDLIASARGTMNTILIGICVLVALLIIVWVIRKIQSRRKREPAMPELEMPEELKEE